MNRKIAYLFAGTVGALAFHGAGLASGPAAGNGANYALTGSAGMLQNQPPVTVTDNRTVQKCTVTSINVVANDSDPEGNLPIVLLSVSAATKGQASVHNGTTVVYESTTQAGLDSLTYTVRDSLGAESNGTLNVTISGGLINCA